MKRVTASEARRLWFRILDEVLEGEVVVITRRGGRIVIRRDDSTSAKGRTHPDYSGILHIREPDSADSWRWEWSGPEQDVALREDADE
ncbi:MAG TPA: type II toxin-antitoxin system prevent-host-death family antitoxin [Longimicrobiales bacterium]|nr:type II toxin-antitoxin system prevent-host-death family antitoxin [Longimicrobiales bacterium]